MRWENGGEIFKGKQLAGFLSIHFHERVFNLVKVMITGM
jgi:hypothetical protein